jgi:hypothetical protein
MLKVTRSLLMFAVGVGAAFPILASAQPNNATGAVFVMSNDASKNEVIAFERAANGTLGESASYETHGRGSGGITDPLESQGSLTLSHDRSLLLVANAGSGTITIFNVHKSAALTFLSETPYRPRFDCSIAISALCQSNKPLPVEQTSAQVTMRTTEGVSRRWGMTNVPKTPTLEEGCSTGRFSADKGKHIFKTDCRVDMS